jgi:propanol-preferring alcohol dehydrogenase
MVATMTAFRMIEWERPPEYQDVPVPTPGPGEVRVKIAGVGLCHTDIHFLHARKGAFPYDPPFTLGHENGGWVDAVGAGVTDLAAGAAVLVGLGPKCWRCFNCLSGRDNICQNRGSGRGWGQDGGLAEYLVVPRRELVPLTSLDPRIVGPLADAGVTPYHAVRKVAPKLGTSSTAILIGAGGLGGYAIQYLKLFTAARVIAVDTAAHRLTRARELGADEVVESDADVDDRLRELTGGRGADAVFDFVGIDATMQTALAQATPGGTVAFVGAGGGSVGVGWGSLPPLCEVFIPFGGTTADLHAVVALAEAGKLQMDVQLFGFAEAAAAYARVEAGDLTGRAVVTLDA